MEARNPIWSGRRWRTSATGESPVRRHAEHRWRNQLGWSHARRRRHCVVPSRRWVRASRRRASGGRTARRVRRKWRNHRIGWGHANRRRYGTGGAPASSAADAGLDGRADGEIDAKSVDAFPGTDTAVNSCENPLPLKCGDRLYHNTLIQGRLNALGFYGCSERVMSGPETIYFPCAPRGLPGDRPAQEPQRDLYVFVLPTCSFMSSCSFMPEVGQPSFVLVDGANGAWGTYTLEVDARAARMGEPATCGRTGGTATAPDAISMSPGKRSPLPVSQRWEPADAERHIAGNIADDANWA